MPPLKRPKQLSRKSWIMLGNRIKHIREELGEVIKDIQGLVPARELDKVLSMERQLDVFKSNLDDVVCKQIPDAIATKIFYGKPLPLDS